MKTEPENMDILRLSDKKSDKVTREYLRITDANRHRDAYMP